MIGDYHLRQISQEKQIIEIASNDGYLLKHFKKHNYSVLGIEPAENIAKEAESNGIPTINKFFGIVIDILSKSFCLLIYISTYQYI